MRLTDIQIVEAIVANIAYGDDGFRREGKFRIRDRVVDGGDNLGVVVKCYVTINDYFGYLYRNPAYRVLFVDGKVRTRRSYDLRKAQGWEIRAEMRD